MLDMPASKTEPAKARFCRILGGLCEAFTCKSLRMGDRHFAKLHRMHWMREQSKRAKSGWQTTV